MNILRCIDINYNAEAGDNPGDGAVIDFEYTQDEKKKFKCVDVRVHSIINNTVGRKMPINIIDKLVIANEMLRYLESENTKQEDNEDNEDV